MEFFKIALVDKAKNCIIIDPITIDGTYDKTVWGRIESKTSTALFHFLSQKQYRVYTIGDYMYCAKDVTHISQNVSDEVFYALNDYYFYKERNYGIKYTTQQKQKLNVIQHNIESRLTNEIPYLYNELWINLRSTNFTFDPRWEQYWIKSAAFIEQTNPNYEHSFFNLEAKTYTHLHCWAYDRQKYTIANPIYNLTQCGKTRLFGYSDRPWLGSYIRFAKIQNKPKCVTPYFRKLNIPYHEIEL